MRNLIALMVGLLASINAVSAAWIQVGGGSGDARVSVVDQSSSGTTFVVDIPGVDVQPVDVDGVEYSRVTLPGGVAARLEVGKPEVPVVPVLLAIPTGSRPTLSIVSTETKTIRVPKVYPLQPPFLLGEAPGPLVVSSGFYSEDVEYPSNRASIVQTATWHDLDVVNVQIFPVVVRPAQNEVVVTSRITVRLDYHGGSYPATVTDWMQPMYRCLIQNYGALGLGPDVGYEPGTRCLVFCHSEYQANQELSQLLDVIHDFGYSTEVIVTQSGVQPEEIKQTIKDRYFNQGCVLRWVLLVGEYDEIPPKANYTKPEWNGKSVPFCDYWYSDLREDDLECDDYPEIGIARLSPQAGTAGNIDLSHQIQKVIDYRCGTAAGDWLAKLALVATQAGGPDGGATSAVRGAATMYLWFYSGVRDTIMGYIPTISNEDLKSSVEQGAGALVYLGHGQSTYWDEWNTQPVMHDWGNAEVQNLQNAYKTPVVFNITCDCGNLDEGT